MKRQIIALVGRLPRRRTQRRTLSPSLQGRFQPDTYTHQVSGRLAEDSPVSAMNRSSRLILFLTLLFR
jgi:hypothetical protein